jgi:hypothetical protein
MASSAELASLPTSNKSKPPLWKPNQTGVKKKSELPSLLTSTRMSPAACACTSGVLVGSNANETAKTDKPRMYDRKLNSIKTSKNKARVHVGKTKMNRPSRPRLAIVANWAANRLRGLTVRAEFSYKKKQFDAN